MRALITLFAALVSGCVSLDVRETGPSQNAGVREAIIPPGTEFYRDEYGFSAAMRAGDFVFVSGVVAGLRPGEEGAAGQEAAYERAFQAIQTALRAGGAEWDDVVDITSYHTDLPTQQQTFRTVKDRYVRAPHPAWTAIDIDRLWPDNGITEIKVIAWAPRP